MGTSTFEGSARPNASAVSGMACDEEHGQTGRLNATRCLCTGRHGAVRNSLGQQVVDGHTGRQCATPCDSACLRASATSGMDILAGSAHDSVLVHEIVKGRQCREGRNIEKRIHKLKAACIEERLFTSKRAKGRHERHEGNRQALTLKEHKSSVSWMDGGGAQRVLLDLCFLALLYKQHGIVYMKR
eukprot:1158006-Pelagomonas_calceolata.AAC.25